MSMRGLIISFLLLLSGFLSAQTQESWCGTPDKMPLRVAVDKSSKKAPSSIVTIPVVIHLFYFSGSGNIADSQIIDGLRVLNEDFNKLNADTSNTSSVFKPFAANVGIEFKLAKLDPNGDSTSGILRFDTLLIPDPEPVNTNFNNVKKASAWPPDRYYNIWLVQSIAGGTLGYAQYPGTDFTYGGPWNTWGIVVRSDQWGTIGTSSSDGRTATHEVGHSFGCYHTFLSQTAGCESACDTTGDEVCDTPPADPSYDCVQKNTCANDTIGPSPYVIDTIDQIENFMSYNSCQSMFSLGQKDRMWMFINQFDTIQHLFSLQNLIETGVLPWTVAIKDPMTIDDVKVSSNPFQGSVSIGVNNEDPHTIVIYNVMGQVVHHRSFTKRTTWTPSGESIGVYFFRLYSSHHKYMTRKLVYLN
jgi:hypothetical protein